MNEKLIETVARAICADMFPDRKDAWAHVDRKRVLMTARAAIAAIEKAGYRIVPVVPTDAMAEAAWDGYAQRMGRDCTNIYFLGDVIGLAIAAAPKVLP